MKLFTVFIYIFFALLSVTGSQAIASHTDNRILHHSFRTLKTEVANDFMSPPVVRLGTADRLLVSFDEIAEDNRYLSVRLIHCDSDWKPSRLVESEYIDGFNTMDIEDWAYSSNTFVHYVNYLLEIPSGNFAPLVSGNYILQVYDRDEPDETLLQTRFRVVEQSVPVSAVVTTRTDKGFNDRYQQLEIVLDGERAGIGNPYQDIKVEIVQNGAEGQ
ncbi:MAG: DUF5103 domain-containing protein [Muribaculaceae bacterium]|nr:DUF5103 domain-containing protein [Muribaculaceae bacterium]